MAWWQNPHLCRLFSHQTFSITQSGSSSTGYTTSGTALFSKLADIDFSDAATASASLATIDSAADNLYKSLGEIGAVSQRLSFSQSNSLSKKTSLEQAISSIEDIDFALESALLAKAMVLQEVNSALLAQANAGSNLVLKLLGDAA